MNDQTVSTKSVSNGDVQIFQPTASSSPILKLQSKFNFKESNRYCKNYISTEEDEKNLAKHSNSQISDDLDIFAIEAELTELTKELLEGDQLADTIEKAL